MLFGNQTFTQSKFSFLTYDDTSSTSLLKIKFSDMLDLLCSLHERHFKRALSMLDLLYFWLPHKVKYKLSHAFSVTYK